MKIYTQEQLRIMCKKLEKANQEQLQLIIQSLQSMPKKEFCERFQNINKA